MVSKQTFELPYYLLDKISPDTNKAGEIVFAPLKLSHGSELLFCSHGIADDEGFRRRYGLVGDCSVSVSPQDVH